MAITINVNGVSSGGGNQNTNPNAPQNTASQTQSAQQTINQQPSSTNAGNG